MKLRDCVEDIWRLVGCKSTLLIFEDLKTTSTSGSIGQQGFVDQMARLWEGASYERVVRLRDLPDSGYYEAY